MRIKILACRNLEAEVRLAMRRSGCTYPLEVLAENNHDVPKLLRQRIQERLDEIQDADRVLLAFTACGGAITGLRSGNFELVIPRVDDCLSLLLGSMERRRAVLEGGFGIFLTKAWLDHERSMPAELRRIYEKYPPERAQKIVKAMYGHFDSLNVIDTGAYDVAQILPRTEELAKMLGLEHRIVPGTLSYLEELLGGSYDPARFLVIPPETEVADADTLIVSSEAQKLN